MLDLQGPGTVYRLWCTGFDTATVIRLYIDGGAAKEYALTDLFAGEQRAISGATGRRQ
jgi:hypothetical protein